MKEYTTVSKAMITVLSFEMFEKILNPRVYLYVYLKIFTIKYYITS